MFDLHRSVDDIIADQCNRGLDLAAMILETGVSSGNVYGVTPIPVTKEIALCPMNGFLLNSDRRSSIVPSVKRCIAIYASAIIRTDPALAVIMESNLASADSPILANKYDARFVRPSGGSGSVVVMDRQHFDAGSIYKYMTMYSNGYYALMAICRFAEPVATVIDSRQPRIFDLMTIECAIFSDAYDGDGAIIWMPASAPRQCIEQLWRIANTLDV